MTSLCGVALVSVYGCQAIQVLTSTLATWAEPADTRELPDASAAATEPGEDHPDARPRASSACQGPGGESQLAQAVCNPRVCSQLVTETLWNQISAEGISLGRLLSDFSSASSIIV